MSSARNINILSGSNRSGAGAGRAAGAGCVAWEDATHTQPIIAEVQEDTHTHTQPIIVEVQEKGLRNDFHKNEWKSFR